MAAIDFLNPAPLMWDFEHEPGRLRLAARYEVRSSTPAECARALAAGAAEIGLVPAAAYTLDPTMRILPGCGIASKGRIRSILLVTRAGGPEAARRVAMDTSSLTSAAYTRILFRKYWNAEAKFFGCAPALEAMLAAADAALLIGDPALLALEDRDARLARTGERLEYFDLAEEWVSRMGVPWVSAFWGVRAGALDGRGLSAAEVIGDFTASRDAGMAHIEDLVAEWTPRIAVPAGTIREYLSRNIHYVLDAECLEGLRVFYRLAAEFAVLPAVEEMRFLGD